MSCIKLVSKGSYFVGGNKITLSGGEPIRMRYWAGGPELTYDPNGDFQAGQMYIQYNRLEDPVLPYPVCMIHGGGGTGAIWESTQKGSPGWEFMFLRNGFNVNLSDGTERGRASWAQFPEINTVPPVFNSYAERWTTYRLGEKLWEPYKGSRFDIDKYDDFIKQQVPRWTTSIPIAQNAYDQYVNSMNEGCILLAHSQGGLFALNAAHANYKNVKAIILIESSSTMDVSKTDVSVFKDIPFLFVWGDFLGDEYCNENYRWIGDFAFRGTMANLHNRLLEIGANSTWLHLPKVGINGNTHAMMVEDNSQQIADIICKWIKDNVC